MASWSAVMMMSGSTPFSLAMASICCNNGLTVAIKLSAVGVLPPALEAGAVAQPNAYDIALSKLDRQLAALDLRDRHPMAAASFLESHRTVLDGDDPPGEGRLAVDRSGRDHLGQSPGESPIIRLVPEWPIQPRRGHFKGVVLRQRPGGFEFLVFDVEEGAQIVADALT